MIWLVGQILVKTEQNRTKEKNQLSIVVSFYYFWPDLNDLDFFITVVSSFFVFFVILF